MLILELYVTIVLGVTGAVYDLTGLYPVEQLSLVREYLDLPASAGVMDTLIAISS